MKAFGGPPRSKVGPAFSRNTKGPMVIHSYNRETAACELANHNVSKSYTNSPTQSTTTVNGQRSASISRQYIVDCIIWLGF